jgi:hypothetical protein
MLKLFKWLSCFGGPRIPRVERYTFSSLKDLELQIVNDAMSGLLQVMSYTEPTQFSVDHHTKVLNRDIKIQVDHAHIGGTFSFIWVQGQELSYSRVEEFDYRRVITAILTRKDVPTTTHSLWNL